MRLIILSIFLLLQTINAKEIAKHDACEPTNSIIKFKSVKYVQGINGNGVLIERRLNNPIKNPNFNKNDNWILIGKPAFKDQGGKHSPACVEIDENNYLRQVIKGLKVNELYCISVYAKSPSPSATLAISMGDQQLGTFETNETFIRYNASFIAKHTQAALTFRSEKGKIILDSVQIDTRIDYPTTFESSGKRGVARGELSPELVNPKCGSISLWMKPFWINKTSTSLNSIFGFGDPSSKNNSYISMRVLPDKQQKEHVWKNRLLFSVCGMHKDIKLFTTAPSPPLQEWPQKPWYHIVATWQLKTPPEKSEIQLFIDAKRVSAKQFLLPAQIDIKKCTFGYWHGGYANAALDEISLYDKALTEQDVAKLNQ